MKLEFHKTFNLGKQKEAIKAGSPWLSSGSWKSPVQGIKVFSDPITTAKRKTWPWSYIQHGTQLAGPENKVLRSWPKTSEEFRLAGYSDKSSLTGYTDASLLGNNDEFCMMWNFRRWVCVFWQPRSRKHAAHHGGEQKHCNLPYITLNQFKH